MNAKPKMREHIQVMYPSGFNGICKKHGSVYWAKRMSFLDSRCSKCPSVLDIVKCEPTSISGYVVGLSGDIVYINPSRRGRVGSARPILWPDVISVKYLD